MFQDKDLLREQTGMCRSAQIRELVNVDRVNPNQAWVTRGEPGSPRTRQIWSVLGVLPCTPSGVAPGVKEYGRIGHLFLTQIAGQ
jgi:hypothetical protein